MSLRPGDTPKLAADAEQALLDKLRAEREMKAEALLQSDVQGLSAKLATMDMQEAIAEGKKGTPATEKSMSAAPVDFRVAIVLNAILRSVSPPESKSDSARKKGGGGKKANAVKAAAAKVVEGEPPEGKPVRKALKANAPLLIKEIQGTESGQLALLKALQSWLLSPQGSAALPYAAKIIEVLYDVDCVEEAVLLSYSSALQARQVSEAAELAEAEANYVTLSAEKAKAEEADKHASGEKAEAARELKHMEYMAQVTRCGSNPSQEDQANEKAALAHLKKALEYHTQMTKVHAARAKNLMEKNAEFEPCQRLVEELRRRKQEGIELFAQHAKPFFDWLATEGDSEDEPAALT